MWLDQEILPALIDAVERTVDEQVRLHESDEGDDTDPDALWDPNDLILLHGFALPVLQDGRTHGVYSEEMPAKAFDLVVMLIPEYLRERRAELAAEVLGGLARVHYQHRLKQAVLYLSQIETRYVGENLARIDGYIEAAKLALEPDA